jgi:shikimate kinase
MGHRNVILTGFMATGKSSVGRLLAGRLGYEWVDTDAVIEARHGPIPEIFSGRGEETFRAAERDLAVELAERDGLVISTGGRMMLDPPSAEALGRGSRVFCLTAAPHEVLRRVRAQHGPKRPLLDGENPAGRIEVLLAERTAAYAQFEQVPTDGRTPKDVVDDVLSRLEVDP